MNLRKSGQVDPALLKGRSVFSNRMRFFLLAGLFMILSPNAYAACSNPAGVAGDMIFNDNQNVMQYCDNTQWIGIGLQSGSIPGGCTVVGQQCDDGSVYAGISPDGNGKMFTTHCDTGMTWNGSICTGTRTFYAYNNANASGDTNASTDSPFDGDGNTTLLLSTDADSATGGTQPHQAATICGDLSVHGRTDWYLPALDELDVLRANRVAIGGFNTTTSPDQRLWSSTQAGQFTAWRQNFGTGVQGDPAKDELNTVRCVRKIPAVSGVAPIPTIIHTVTADYPYHLVKESNYIYVADNWNSASEGGMNIFNATDPASMSLVGSISHANMQGAWGIDVAGTYAFVAAEQDDGVASVNVSTPSSPTYSHFVTHANLGGARGLKIAGDHAFVAAYDVDRLTSVNITNPAAMTYAGSVTHTSMDGASDVDVQGVYAYVASAIADSLTVVLIYDPAAPTRSGSVNGMDGANSVVVSGNYAYVTASNADALYVVNISNPAAPTIAGSVTDALLDGATGVALKGPYAIVSAGGTSDRLVVVDVSNPAAPSIFGSSVSDSAALSGGDLVVDGNYAYVIGDFKLSSVNMAPPCASPAGIKGDIIYNGDDFIMQYCDGSGAWRAMGHGGSAGTCSNPAGAQGDILYNSTSNLMQFCAGSWVAIGH